ncbi:hypothetical protein CEXT_529261 [Caerostris extrusa]|uniref:Uncharacterized protein n=1 Tax=Caerostris extrusa TaxID=172846 RepID=A0AAV4S4Z2_CAEEX|nr:hypothetical protein CEXT_529261 [Caerostris extrusa]
MSALDYEKNFKIMSSENSDEKSLTKVESASNNSNEADYQNFKVSNPLRLLNISYNECSSTANNLEQCKILNDQDDMNFEEYTEMDDDFNLTASQLLMLDADERMQSNFECNAISTGQQTDECVISDIRNDAIILEIVDQLHSIK